MATKQKQIDEASNALPDSNFVPEDYTLQSANDKIVSRVLGSKKIFNVFTPNTIGNLSIKDGLLDGIWQIEDELTGLVKESMNAKLKAAQANQGESNSAES